MPAENVFSKVCSDFVAEVGELIDAANNDITLVIGPPAAAEKTPPNNSVHLLNFFFYKFHPWEFDTDLAPGDVLRIRASCMITPICKEVSGVSASEHELRAVGEVLRALHENASMPLNTYTAGSVSEDVHLQIALQRVEAEELNHLWSTQPEATQRSSLVYEIALVPVIPEREPFVPPLVGSTAVRVRPKIDRAWATPGGFDGVHDLPEVEKTTVDTTREGWAPVLCLVKDGVCARVIESTAAAFDHTLWIAGEKDAEVRLHWRVWTREDGWQDGPTVEPRKAIGPEMDPASPPDETDSTAGDGVTDGGLVLLTLPDAFDTKTGHAVLVAERVYTLAREQKPNGDPGPERSVLSEPVLVVVTP